MSKALLTVAVQLEQDVVTARQRARQIAHLLGFDPQDQTRIATAVSEIARNAFRYANGGRVEFSLEGDSVPQLLIITISDKGPGITNLASILRGEYRSGTGMGIGLTGAHRLMDQMDVHTAPGEGTRVILKKLLPARRPLVSEAERARIARELAAQKPAGALEELQQQNQELVRALSELRERQEELERINRELEDTNRGVVALYAELDEKADHLRRADEMKSRFLSNMSHEFRTPVNSIRALSRLLLDRVDGPLTPEQERQVGFINKSAMDLAALVDDLLDLAKIEAGKVEVRPVEFTVANLFSALRGMLRPLLTGEQVRLVFEEPPDDLTLYTDEGKVSQIVRNFISNALKFTERGEVRVSAQLSGDGRQITFAVSDTGIGIDPKDQTRIFDEFTQVANPLQGKVKGTGLGLPLCRRLARLLGGDVAVESTPQVGSTFTATVPARFRESGMAAIRGSDVRIDAELLPILLIEDDPQTLHAHERMLADSRYQALCARSLREARQLMGRVRPCAIVLDILLPGEDAWPWLVELKSNPSTASIPIIIATVVDDERKGLALGADAYCAKPLDRATLLEKLDAFCSRQVLVIDDDPASRYLLHKLLEGERTRVIEASDCASALIVARRTRPSLIFLDLNLPDRNGEELLVALKNDSALHSVPVAIVTSRMLTPEERARLAAHADSVLEKSELSVERAREILAHNGM